MGYSTATATMKSFIGLLFVSLLVLSMFLHQVESSRKPVNCRKYVHMPQCRGVAAKRDTLSRLSDDYRLEEREDVGSAEVNPLGDNLNGRNLLIALLKRAVEKSIDYDTGTGNYVK